MTAMAFLSLTFCCIWPEGGGQDRNEECGWGLPLSKATDAVRQSSLASPRFCAPSGPGMTMAPTCCWYYLIPVDFLNLAHTFVYNLLNIPQITHFECVFIAKTLINTIFYLYTFGISPSKVCVCVCVCVHAQSCPTLCDPMYCSPPGSSVHAIFSDENTRVGCHFLLRGSSRAGIKPTSLLSPAVAGGFFTTMPPGKPPLPTTVPQRWATLKGSFLDSQLISPHSLPETFLIHTSCDHYVKGFPIHISNPKLSIMLQCCVPNY